MRVMDVLKLAHTNVKGHLGRTVMTVLTVSVVFGVVVGANFVLKGLERSLLEFAGEKTEGKVYVVSVAGGSAQEDVMRENGGEEVGRIMEYEITGTRNTSDANVPVAEEKVVKGFLTEAVDGVAIGKLPIVCTRDGGFRCEDVVESALGVTEDEYEIVGMMPDASGTLKLGQKDLVNLNPLNLVLGNIGFHEPYLFLVVDDGRERIAELIEAMRIRAKQEQEENEIETGGNWWAAENEVQEGSEVELLEIEKKVIKFETAEEAYDYIEEMNKNQNNVRAREIFGNQTSVVAAIKNAEKTLGFAMWALTVVAVIIMAVTFAHLISMEVRTVMLYRSMGATTGQVVMIYLAYLVELCLMAVVVATVIGALIAGVMTIMNAAELERVLSRYYEVERGGRILLWGWSAKYWCIVGLMMLIAPVAFLLIYDQLSVKYLARKLKEDVGE